MTTLADIIAGARPGEAGLRFDIPPTWMQGRTAYGGLSSALALHAAQATAADLPPLRTAQISFVGPLAGAVEVPTKTLRRGRTAAFVSANVQGETGLGLGATFVFMGDQPSHIDHVALPAPLAFPDPFPAPRSSEKVEYFFQNFEYVEAAGDFEAADYVRWVRLKARDGLDPMVALMAVADALPPAAMGLATQRGPISSMTWLVNMLTAKPETRDGWWLLHSRTDYARNGCSSQSMAIWNADGVPVASGMQSVALFI
ncbi:thioesterase family protein [Sphingomonas cavernae]|uniref:Thioesterase family protein n=1 Tax=Sphingomonas cavernae TaxID=2320861 RepID=A0A418WRT6_9SPHN|nr:thioesterase family protein [Sphingomonas cavernae]RJF93972.1 thioesterase family protein [Sphingomonas cavernae]